MPNSILQKNKILIGVILFLTFIVVYLLGKSQSLLLGINEVQKPTPTIEQSTPTPTYMPSPTTSNTYYDPDPIVNCGPGQISKQYVKDRSSNCKNYTDCGLNNNTLYTLMLISECEKKHAESSSNNQTKSTTTNNGSNRTAVYVSSVAGGLLYCNPQNIDAIKGLDSAIIQARQKASELYSGCLQAKLDNCNLDWTYANSLSNQLMNLCNQGY